MKPMVFLFMLLFVIPDVRSQDVKVLSFPAFQEAYLQPQDEMVVFNFWATWCKPCVKELPYFLSLAEEDGIRLVLVSLDFPRMMDARLIPFLRDNDIRREVVLLDERNPNNFINAIDSTWQGSIPATLLWKEGKVAFAEKEFHSVDELRQFVQINR